MTEDTSAPHTDTAPRKRDSEATAARILDAARVLFGQHGYDAVSTRDIAAEAEVNVALINRYFGSKAGLFRQAILPSNGMTAAQIAADLSNLGRVKSAWLVRPPDESVDPMAAVLRSAMSPGVQDMIHQAILENGITPIAAALDGEDREIRAHMIVATLAGLDLWLRRLGGLEGSDLDRERMAERIAALLDGLVSDTAPGA